MDTGAKLGKVNELSFVGPDGKSIAVKIDNDFRPCSFGASGKFAAGIAFCGYGIEAKNKNYQDFAGIDVNGKVVIIMRRTPGQQDPHGAFGGTQTRILGSLRTKYRNAFKKGAVAVLFVNDPHSTRAAAAEQQENVKKAQAAVIAAAETFDQAERAAKKNSKQIAEAREKLSVAIRRLKAARKAAKGNTDALMDFGYGGNPNSGNKPIFHISQETCDKLLKATLNKSLAQIEAEIDEDLKPRSALLTGWTAKGQASVETVKTEVKNVIGVLEGEGPLANETIVVGAHYDHVGFGKYGSLAPGSTAVHNGADDNASGTVSLIELARRLGARKKKLPRRIVFIAFTAEELGLIGSARYTAKPVFPLKDTIAMFNMDMVGRMVNNKLTVFGIGTAPRWKDVVNKSNKYNFKLSLKPEGFGPSDQSSFYAKKIPVLHLFTDTHRDYHRPSDDWEKINFQGMANVVNMLEEIVVTTAETKDRPKYIEVKRRARISRQRQGARPYFGVIPSFGSDAKGCEISGTSAGGPAQKAGLKGGDVIVKIGKHQVENLSDFDLALRTFKAGQTPKKKASKYIDAHTHIGTYTNGNKELTVKGLLDWMDEHDVEKSVVLPLVSPESTTYIQLPDAAIKAAKAHPDRLVAFCSIDPRSIVRGGVKGLTDIIRKYVDQGAKGFGEHKVGLKFDDPLMMRVYEACETVGIPLLFHLDTVRGMDEPGLPRLEHALATFPKLNFIGHGPGWWASISGGVKTKRDLGGYPKTKVQPGGAIDRLMAKRKFAMYNEDEYERYDNVAAPASGRRRKKGMRTWLIVLLVLAVPAGILLLIVGAGVLFVMTASNMPVTATDRSVLFTAKELEGRLDDFNYDPAKEVITKEKYIDNSYDLDYEYEDESVIVLCNVTVDTSVSDAKASFSTMWAGSKLVLGFDSEVDVMAQDHWLRWGDESRFATLKSNGETFGHMLIVRKGTRVFYLGLSGVYFEDAQQLNEFIMPTLAKLEGYQP
eukprot:g8429.t1